MDAKEMANAVISQCDQMQAALRDGDEDTCRQVRLMLGEMIELSDARQLAAFLTVVRAQAQLLCQPAEQGRETNG